MSQPEPHHPPRASWDEYFMNIARVVASRSTCPRKFVGAVIVRDGRVIALHPVGAELLRLAVPPPGTPLETALAPYPELVGLLAGPASMDLADGLEHLLSQLAVVDWRGHDPSERRGLGSQGLVATGA